MTPITECNASPAKMKRNASGITQGITKAVAAWAATDKLVTAPEDTPAITKARKNCNSGVLGKKSSADDPHGEPPAKHPMRSWRSKAASAAASRAWEAR